MNSHTIRARSMEGSLWLPLRLSFSRPFQLPPCVNVLKLTLKLFLAASREVFPRRRMPTFSTVSMPAELSYTKVAGHSWLLYALSGFRMNAQSSSLRVKRTVATSSSKNAGPKAGTYSWAKAVETESQTHIKPMPTKCNFFMTPNYEGGTAGHSGTT